MREGNTKDIKLNAQMHINYTLLLVCASPSHTFYYFYISHKHSLKNKVRISYIYKTTHHFDLKQFSKSIKFMLLFIKNMKQKKTPHIKHKIKNYVLFCFRGRLLLTSPMSGLFCVLFLLHIK